MKTLIFGLLAYIVMTGCGLLAGRLLKLRLTEGMIFAVAGIDLVLYAAGAGGRFSAGITVLCVLALAGFCCAVIGDLRAARDSRSVWDSRSVRDSRVVRDSQSVRDSRAARDSQSAGNGGGRRRLTLMQELLSPYYVMLTVIFVSSLVLYYGDFIWHIDEFHLYALSPKYMLETGKLPLEVSFIPGAKDVLAGSLFHLFFQEFTGYNEGMMYVSSTLLTWIGLYLPFAFTFGSSGGLSKEGGAHIGSRKGGWSGIVLYTAILYIGTYSLYGYGIKNLYVDLPTLSWAAGLAGWWMVSSDSFVTRFVKFRSFKGRDQKRGISFEVSEILLVLVVLVMVTLFKPHIGLLLAVLCVLFLLTEEVRRYFSGRELADPGAGAGAEGGSGQNPPSGRGLGARKGRPRWKTVLLALAAILVLAVLAVLTYAWNVGRTPEGMMNFLGNAGSSLREKAKPVVIAFTTAIVGNSLSSNSELKLTLPTVSVLILAIFLVGSDLKNDRKRGLVYMAYSIGAEILYLCALFAAFLFIFSYEESIKVAGIGRYMTGILLYLLIIALVWLLVIPAREVQTDGTLQNAGVRAADAGRLCRYVGLALLIFLCLGLDRDYVPNHTALNKEKAVGYEDIKRAREQSKEVKAVLKEGERVYILNQSNTNEFPTNCALYYLGGAVNNYLREPWKFTKIGNITRLREGNEITVRDFPDILRDGGYSYVWIYTTDGYLNEALPEVMEVTWDTGEPEAEAAGPESEAAEPEIEAEAKTGPVLANNRLYRVETGEDGSVCLVRERELWK